LDVVIANIRKKLGKRFIETVPATGYRLWSKEKEES
jgi:DNA-binding response OmpR family regulator